MIFLVHSETETSTIVANLGASEYSYYFVLQEFRPMLAERGIVIPLADPAHEADAVWQNAAARGVACVYLTFSPPHRSVVGKNCPTIPVFAWEFDTIPTESWDDEPRHDWRTVLAAAGQAITHSRFAVEVVRQAMGPDFPVVSLPAPVWDRFAPLYHAHAPRNAGPRPLRLRGLVLDTDAIDLSPHNPTGLRANPEPGLPKQRGHAKDITALTLHGVVYTSVFCPNDGRKNWFDLIGGFCWALRDQADATLVLKLTHRDSDAAILAILHELAKLAPFQCRVVIIDAFLDDETYLALAAASDYTVNTSHGEGQCLPLMEYMSAGRPAISPDHTAMADYLDTSNAFVVASHTEPGRWPHDPRLVFRGLRRRIDFESLVTAYRDSHAVATQDAPRYARMAAAAHERLRRHCSREVIGQAFGEFLGPLLTADG